MTVNGRFTAGIEAIAWRVNYHMRLSILVDNMSGSSFRVSLVAVTTKARKKGAGNVI